MTIKTKYNIDDTVCAIHRISDYIEESCELCNGTGTVHIQENGETLKCPKCNGLGHHTQIVPVYTKIPYTIKDISCFVKNEDVTSVVYRCEDTTGKTLSFPQDLIFKEKEADKIIDGKGIDPETACFKSFNEQISKYDDSMLSTSASAVNKDDQPRKKLF